ncbi:MAG: tetratricopeptide repeat protein [Bacteroidales bacterium]|nr:tetratricopeptide repeat protein [Bacteroidales bacterium]
MKIKTIITSIILFALSLTAIAQDDSDRNTDAFFAKSVQRYEDGKYAEARTMFKQIVEKHPGHDAAWYYIGQCDMFLKEYELAAVEFNKAIAIDSTNYWYYDRLSFAYAYQKDNDATALVCEKIIKKFPKRSEAFYRLLDIYLSEEKYDKALMALDNVESSDGQNEQTVITRYQILMKQDKKQEAKDVLVKYNKNNLSLAVLGALGNHEMNEYNDSLALAYFNEALSIDSEYNYGLQGKAEIYRMRRNYDEYFKTLQKFVGAESIPSQEKSEYLNLLMQNIDPRFFTMFHDQMETVIDKTVELHPKDSLVITNAIKFNYLTNNNGKAIDFAKQLVDIKTDQLSSTLLLVQLMQSDQRWQESKDELDSALVSYPNEPTLLFYKNTSCYQLKEFKECEKCLETILSVTPVDTVSTPEILSILGEVYWRLNDSKNCFKAFEMVLKLKPEHDQTLNNYAYFLSEVGKKLKKAEEMSYRTIVRNPDNPYYLDTYAWILHLNGKDKEAKVYFKQAMMYGGKESKVSCDHYAEVLEALGENELASYYRMLAKDNDE